MHPEAIQSSLTTQDTARAILNELTRYRRTESSLQTCQGAHCSHCANTHLPTIVNAIKGNKPLQCVLPGFPGKSPNLNKVLGHLPDQAERIALQFLNTLCQRVKSHYAPGMKVILCSDGRVFSDAVGIDEQHLTQYQHNIQHLITTLQLDHLSCFNLDDAYERDTYTLMRQKLMQDYGSDSDALKQKISRGKHSGASALDQEANRMYRGITRFLFEDSLHPKQTSSKTSLQKSARQRAYDVILRSNAWSELIAKQFPQALRFSIHPQACGASKFGLRLIGNESWLTPWHGVAVETQHGTVLMKRHQAETAGANLVFDKHGQPSHFQLNTNGATA